MVGRPRKLSVSKQQYIRRALANGRTMSELARLYDVDIGTIRYTRDHPPRHAGGHPPGTTIRLKLNPRQNSAYILIGKVLWNTIGKPERVDIAVHPNMAGLIIRPGTERATGGSNPTILRRVSIPLDLWGLIGLDEGTYPARATRRGMVSVEVDDGRSRCHDCKHLMSSDEFVPSRPGVCRACHAIRNHKHYLARKARDAG